MTITRCVDCGAIQVPGETYLNCYDCGGELFEYEYEEEKIKVHWSWILFLWILLIMNLFSASIHLIDLFFVHRNSILANVIFAGAGTYCAFLSAMLLRDVAK